MRAYRTRIKVCGLTRPEDAAAAAAAGADALGVIFADSPRRVTPEHAAEVLAAAPPFVSRVGVFVDADAHEVAELADELGLTHVQLSGSESPEYCRRMPVPTIKALHVGGDGDLERAVEQYADVVDALLFDTFASGLAGGTGERFDTALIAGLSHDVPLVVAGGLAPGNVADVIGRLAPYAVDVCSGVEASPGVKEHALLTAFCGAVRAADGEAARRWV